MTRFLPLALALAFASTLAGCRADRPRGPIEAAVVGAPIDRATLAADSDRGAIGDPAGTLALATRQGLVRFDAVGQIVPGVAARWIVSDNGRSLIFRLPDGAANAPAIVARLRAAVAPASRNPLKPLLGAIAAIDAVTPQVVDIELSAPRPNLLPLFAQPALALGAEPGGGPFDVVALRRGVATLRTRPRPAEDPDDPPPPPTTVALRADPAGRAVARFRAGRVALVLGGRVGDLPVPRVAGLPDGRLRFDPAPGLFGFAFDAGAAGFAADPDDRRLLAMAIDRDRIAAQLGIPNWRSEVAIVPAGTAEIDAPSRPSWAAATLDDRRTIARQAVAAWRAANGAIGPLRVAMPDGPGARLLFAQVAADWLRIGVPAVRVGAGDPADLRFVDEVAPADTAAFYLRRFACERGVVCTAASDRVLIAARETPSLDERRILLVQADALIEANAPFVAIGRPVRWSLVAPSLDGWRESPRAIHPLDMLRAPDR